MMTEYPTPFTPSTQVAIVIDAVFFGIFLSQWLVHGGIYWAAGALVAGTLTFLVLAVYGLTWLIKRWQIEE